MSRNAINGDPLTWGNPHHLTIDWVDRVVADQLGAYKDYSEINEHKNEKAGWEEHLEHLDECGLDVRWWEYEGKGRKDGILAPLVVCLYEYFNTSWMHVADHEGLVVVTFEYHRNQRRPEGGLGALGFGPREDEIIGYHTVIQRCIEKYGCDPKRVYINGLSYGDMSTMLTVQKYPDEFAGAAFVNGPSSWFNIDRYGCFESMPAIPTMHFRSDDDFTCDGFPFPDHTGIEDWLRNIRSRQTVINRDVWMGQNGCNCATPQIRTDAYRAFLRYPGAEGKGDTIFVELNRHSHIMPIDNAQLMWDNLFSRYRRAGDGGVECLDGSWRADEGAVAMVAGLPAAYVGNAKVGLPAAPVILDVRDPQPKMSVTYCETECAGSTFYAPVEILKDGFGLDWSYRKNDLSLSEFAEGSADDEITLEDGVITFACGGRTYELLTNTAIAMIDGKVRDIERPPLTIGGHLMVPVKHVAELLGLFASERNDAIYVCDHPFEMGFTLTRLLREEVLPGERYVPVFSAKANPTENGACEISADRLQEGRTLTLKVAPDSGYKVDRVTAWMNGFETKADKIGEDEWWVCNVLGDVEVEVAFKPIA